MAQEHQGQSGSGTTGQTEGSGQKIPVGGAGEAPSGTTKGTVLGSAQQEGELARSGWLSALRDESVAPFFGASPFTLFRRMTEEMDRLLFGSPSAFAFAGRFAPQIELAEHDGKLWIRADLPGCTSDDFRVDVQENSLILSGERRSEEEHTRGGVHRSERTYGSFRRVIPLPPGADVDAAEARFQNGVLEISIPLPEQPRARRLEVRSETTTSPSEVRH
jgi:HSP20 family protein